MAKRKVQQERKESKNINLPLPEPILEHHRLLFEPILEHWFSAKKVPPVLLLTGSEGVGKGMIVHFLSQWLNCEKNVFHSSFCLPGDEESGQSDLFGEGSSSESSEQEMNSFSLSPCGACSSCQRALSGNWIDFQEIAPEKREDGKVGSIKIDQLRHLQAEQGFGAHTSAFKVFLIQNAESMTPQAANSLLKILEEPPRNWIFFLTASDSSLLLPTLTSRCQKLKLRPYSVETLELLLKQSGVSADRSSVSARLAGGSWEKARLISQDEHWSQRKKVFLFLENPQLQLPGLVDWAAKDLQQLKLLLDQLEQVIEELLGTTVSSDWETSRQWVSIDGAQSLEAHRKKVVQHFGSLEQSRFFWFRCAEKISVTRRKMEAPLNRKLLVQDLLFPWLEVGV